MNARLASAPKILAARTACRLRAIATSGVALFVLLAGADGAAAINRCEGKDGRVTYTDEPCPATARSVRKVDDSPPVVSRETPSGRPADAKEGQAEAKGTGAKSAPQFSAEAAKSAAPLQVQPGRITASTSPEQEIQRLDELRERQRRQCAEASRRVDYALKDLEAATGPDRASAELVVRRVQEEARAVCPPR
jgi:hypothetical protein